MGRVEIHKRLHLAPLPGTQAYTFSRYFGFEPFGIQLFEGSFSLKGVGGMAVIDMEGKGGAIIGTGDGCIMQRWELESIHFKNSGAGQPLLAPTACVRYFTMKGCILEAGNTLEDRARDNIGSGLRLNLAGCPDTGIVFVSIVIADSVFRNNFGYAIWVFVQRGGTNLHIDIHNNSFTNNTGGVKLFSYRLRNSVFNISDNVFENNTDCGAPGGALLVGFNKGANNNTCIVSDNIFKGNSAGLPNPHWRRPAGTVPDGTFVGGFGGALAMVCGTTDVHDVRLYILRNVFESNVASEIGGALFIAGGVPDPLNLAFEGCGKCPNPLKDSNDYCANPDACKEPWQATPVQRVYRKWAYETIATIASCDFHQNTARGSGGALGVRNADTRIEDCTVRSNSGVLGGGMCFEGSTQVVVNGSRIYHNIALHGSQIYSSSGASLNVTHSTVTLIPSSLDKGIIGVNIGEVDFEGSTVECQTGYQIIDLSVYDLSTIFDSWTLRPALCTALPMGDIRRP
jgi:hypothetical protein